MLTSKFPVVYHLKFSCWTKGNLYDDQFTSKVSVFNCSTKWHLLERLHLFYDKSKGGKPIICGLSKKKENTYKKKRMKLK
jgi:hypothetical protein